MTIVEAHNLVNAGFELSTNDYSVLENLAARKDLLIDDVITDNAAPVLFATFLRRLMDGENILIITAKRCYSNSDYHKEIVKWMDDWFYRLTGNKEFWRVQVFSKVEDVELTAPMIVTSADDLLDKNVLREKWFENLKTILFLNGEEIFCHFFNVQ